MSELEVAYLFDGLSNGRSQTPIVDKLAKCLSEEPYGFRVTRLLGPECSVQGLLEIFDDLVHREPAAVLFYFLGHGGNRKFVGPEACDALELIEDLELPYLRLDANDHTEESLIYGFEISDRLLTPLAERGVTTTAIFDCCYSGELINVDLQLNRSVRAGKTLSRLQVLTAAGDAAPWANPRLQDKLESLAKAHARSLSSDAGPGGARGRRLRAGEAAPIAMLSASTATQEAPTMKLGDEVIPYLTDSLLSLIGPDPLSASDRPTSWTSLLWRLQWQLRIKSGSATHCSFTGDVDAPLFVPRGSEAPGPTRAFGCVRDHLDQWRVLGGKLHGLSANARLHDAAGVEFIVDDQPRLSSARVHKAHPASPDPEGPIELTPVSEPASIHELLRSVLGQQRLEQREEGGVVLRLLQPGRGVLPIVGEHSASVGALVSAELSNATRDHHCFFTILVDDGEQIHLFNNSLSEGHVPPDKGVHGSHRRTLGEVVGRPLPIRAETRTLTIWPILSLGRPVDLQQMLKTLVHPSFEPLLGEVAGPAVESAPTLGSGSSVVAQRIQRYFDTEDHIHFLPSTRLIIRHEEPVSPEPASPERPPELGNIERIAPSFSETVLDVELPAEWDSAGFPAGLTFCVDARQAQREQDAWTSSWADVARFWGTEGMQGGYATRAYRRDELDAIAAARELATSLGQSMASLLDGLRVEDRSGSPTTALELLRARSSARPGDGVGQLAVLRVRVRDAGAQAGAPLGPGAHALLKLPWELLYFDGEFVVRSGRCIVVRDVSGSADPPSLTSAPLAVLGHHAAPLRSAAFAKIEVEAFRDKLIQGVGEHNVRMTPLGTLQADLHAALTAYPGTSVLHLTCHGTADGELVFEDEQGAPACVTVDELRAVGAARDPWPDIELVSLCCCYGAGGSVHETEPGDHWAGAPAVAFASAGASVVAYFGDVWQSLAIDVNERFFRYLRQPTTNTTRQALARVRIDIPSIRDEETGGYFTWAWAALVLYDAGTEHHWTEAPEDYAHPIPAPTRIEYFGRRPLLTKLRTMLSEHHWVGLHGLHGFGKTAAMERLFDVLGLGATTPTAARLIVVDVSNERAGDYAKSRRWMQRVTKSDWRLLTERLTTAIARDTDGQLSWFADPERLASELSREFAGYTILFEGLHRLMRKRWRIYAFCWRSPKVGLFFANLLAASGDDANARTEPRLDAAASGEAARLRVLLTSMCRPSGCEPTTGGWLRFYLASIRTALKQSWGELRRAVAGLFSRTAEPGIDDNTQARWLEVGLSEDRVIRQVMRRGVAASGIIDRAELSAAEVDHFVEQLTALAQGHPKTALWIEDLLRTEVDLQDALIERHTDPKNVSYVLDELQSGFRSRAEPELCLSTALSELSVNEFNELRRIADEPLPTAAQARAPATAPAGERTKLRWSLLRVRDGQIRARLRRGGLLVRDVAAEGRYRVHYHVKDALRSFVPVMRLRWRLALTLIAFVVALLPLYYLRQIYGDPGQVRALATMYPELFMFPVVVLPLMVYGATGTYRHVHALLEDLIPIRAGGSLVMAAGALAALLYSLTTVAARPAYGLWEVNPASVDVTAWSAYRPQSARGDPHLVPTSDDERGEAQASALLREHYPSRIDNWWLRSPNDWIAMGVFAIRSEIVLGAKVEPSFDHPDIATELEDIGVWQSCAHSSLADALLKSRAKFGAADAEASGGWLSGPMHRWLARRSWGAAFVPPRYSGERSTRSSACEDIAESARRPSIDEEVRARALPRLRASVWAFMLLLGCLGIYSMAGSFAVASFGLSSSEGGEHTRERGTLFSWSRVELSRISMRFMLIANGGGIWILMRVYTWHVEDALLGYSLPRILDVFLFVLILSIGAMMGILLWRIRRIIWPAILFGVELAMAVGAYMYPEAVVQPVLGNLVLCMMAGLVPIITGLVTIWVWFNSGMIDEVPGPRKGV